MELIEKVREPDQNLEALAKQIQAITTSAFATESASQDPLSALEDELGTPAKSLRAGRRRTMQCADNEDD